MVAVRDQRPLRPDDSLKRLINNLNTPASVPHGVKVAQPDERVVFYDSSYVARTWDGDAIADFDSRISEAKSAVEATQASLDAAKADLEEAKSRIQASTGDFSQYADRISASEQKLAEAQAAQAALEQTLSSTQSDVQGLASKADATAQDVQSVSDSLSNVSTVAQKAQDAATQAQTSVNNVSAQADNAADTAQKALNEARAPVTVDRLVVNGDLAAAVVNAMDANVKRLVVTEDALLNNATFLGSTVADQLNVTKRLVARDAIVNGTLDVAQLNVTEAMSAEIVKAMSVEAKKLVVTDEAILNKATVVQSLVTPELVAQKISSALITGSTIQTSAAPNEGVKIDSTGYKAYGADGTLAVNLNGQNNFVHGTFRTAPDGKAGIKISQTTFVAGIDLYPTTVGMNETYPDRHGAVWFDSSSRFSENGLIMSATQRAGVVDSDPTVLLMPQLGIAFNGRFANNVGTAMQTGVTLGNSIEKGGWWTLNVTFDKPLTTDPAVFISPVTENGVECAIGIKTATRFGFTATVMHSTATRSSGKACLKWVAMAI